MSAEDRAGIADRGHWERRDPPWWHVEVVNCTLCGQRIPRDLWIVDDAGRRRIFCGPDCERLYGSYWRGKYEASSKCK